MDKCGNFNCKRYDCLEDNNCKKWNIIVGCLDYKPLTADSNAGAEVPCSEWWLDQNECECEGGHVCGRDERMNELRQIKEAIALYKKSV